MYALDCAVTLDVAKTAVQKSLDCGYVAGEAQGLLWWGRSLWILVSPKEALSLLRKALRLARQLDEPRLQAECHDALANCQQMLGNARKAFTSWADSLELALVIDAGDLCIEALNGLGNLYVIHDDHQTAFHYHALAVEFAPFVDDPDIRCKAFLHLAADLIKLQQHELAIGMLLRAEQSLVLPRRQNWQAEIYAYLGNIAASKGDTREAERHLLAAHRINLAAGLFWGQAVNLLGLGKLKLQLGEHEAANHFLLQGVELAERFNAGNLLMQMHEQLYQSYEALGDHARAVMHHIGYHTHFLQLAQQDSSRQLQSLSARRLHHIEMRLKLLGSEMEISQLRRQSDAGRKRLAWLESAAYQDGLTGAYNRRVMDERVPQLIAHAQQSLSPISALLLDFDHFKQINDQHSHLLGDQVLQMGCKLFLAQCRDGDLLVRFGGEEFLLFLPGVAIEVASKIAERICTALPKLDWAALQPGLAVTVSIGVGQLQADETVADWLQRIDQALYAAKRGGRNRVCLAGEAP